MKKHFGRSLNSTAAAKRTLFVLACFYVAAGLAVAVSTAVAGDPIGAFLGFLIVTGTIAIAVAFNMLFHLQDSTMHTQQSIDEILHRLEQPAADPKPQIAEPATTQTRPATTQVMPPAPETEVSMLDLVAIGPGDPSLLAAVRLDRDMFPRLVTEMENHPPARSEATIIERPTTPTQIDSLRENADDGLNASDLPSLESGAQRLAGEKPGEAILRQEFADMIRRQDFAGALAVGRRIVAIHPDQDIAREFLQIEPILSSKLHRPARSAPPPHSKAAGNS